MLLQNDTISRPALCRPAGCLGGQNAMSEFIPLSVPNVGENEADAAPAAVRKQRGEVASATGYAPTLRRSDAAALRVSESRAEPSRGEDHAS